MNKLYVIGNPIRHSKSPAIHNYWIKNYSLNAIYNKLEVRVEEISTLLDQVRNGTIKGLNITIPFKKAVIPYLDELESSAKRSKAVNTVFRRGNNVVGANTDGTGFLKSITEDLKVSLKQNFNVFCLGSGGAAYGIISELANQNPKTVWVSNRTINKAKELVQHFREIYPNTQFNIIPWGGSPRNLHNIFINTTSIGMNKNDRVHLHLDNLPLDSLVYDIIYNPPRTVIMKMAEQRNLKNVNGSFMLIRQAAAAFKKWFGIELNSDDIHGALKILNENA